MQGATWHILQQYILKGVYSGYKSRKRGGEIAKNKMKPARSEQEFQSILRRLELALDASQIGVWEHNTGTDEVLWDLQMHRLYVTDTTQRNSSYRP